MQLSHEWIRTNVVEPLWHSGVVTDYASEYGEPGYDFGYKAETPIFLIGYWWCRCGNNPHAGRPKYGLRGDEEGVVQPGDLHSVDQHHPRVWAQLESQGVESAFYDEWTVVDGKAYRTTADSYTWQSSIQLTDDGEYLTPDDDIEEWVAWAVNDHQRCLMREYRHQLAEAGFVKWEPDDPHDYQAGWHPGQTDEPKVVTDEIRETSDDDIVFVLDETSQFYVGFSAWTRPPQQED